MEEEKISARKISAQDGREYGWIEDPVSMVARRTVAFPKPHRLIISTPNGPNNTLKGLFIE